MCKGVTQMYKPLTDKDGKLFYILDEDAAEEMLDLQDEAVECVETMIDALNTLKDLIWSIPIPNDEPFPQPKPMLDILPVEHDQNDLPF